MFSVTMTCGSGAPMAAAPSWTPFQQNSLNDLSSSWPMSVTMPIFIVVGSTVFPLGVAEAGALPLGCCDAGWVAGADPLGLWVLPVLVQAAMTIIIPTSTTTARLRIDSSSSIAFARARNGARGRFPQRGPSRGRATVGAHPNHGGSRWASAHAPIGRRHGS